MRGRPATEKQIRYLRSLGDHGPEPVDMADASWRIDAAKRKNRPLSEISQPGNPTPAVIRLASEHQIQMLRQIGYEGPPDITAAQAVKVHSYLRQTKDR